MTPELRDRLVKRLDELTRDFGGNDFVTGAAGAALLFEKLAAAMEPMTSTEKLNAFLDAMPQPSKAQELYLFAFLRFLPSMFRVWITKLGKISSDTLPPQPGGRPATDQKTRVEVVAFILQLIGKKVDVEIAKKRAALRFGISEGTVQRIWDDRDKLPDPDFKSTLKWISDEIGSEAP